MEDRETPRMSKHGESKATRIMMATVLPVRDLENFRPMDFCSTECTCITIISTLFPVAPTDSCHFLPPFVHNPLGDLISPAHSLLNLGLPHREI